MKKRGKLPIVLGVLLLVFVGLVIWRIPYVQEQERSLEAVKYIESRALSMKDVDGNSLPPPPDRELNEATIEGVDANENNIRDDVELAIFELYPDYEDRKVRAAELQYAMAMQIFLTNVFTEETWVAASQQEGRAFGCIFNTLPKLTLEDGQEKATENHNLLVLMEEEVEALVLNTQKRKDYYMSLNKNNATTLKSSDKEDCDLNI